MSSFLPLDLLCGLIEDTASVETNAIESFLKLMQYCYIENNDYQPIRLISHVKEWHTIEN